MEKVVKQDRIRSVEHRTVETWRTAVRSIFTELDVEPAPAQRFSGSLALATRANLQVTNIRASAQCVARTSAAIRHAPTEHVYLVWQQEGHGRVEHEGGVTTLSVGETVLYDPDRPHTLVFTDEFAQICIKVPRLTLAEHLPGHTDVLLQPRSSISPGSARILSAVTQALLDEPGENDEHVVADLFFDVLSRSLSWEEGRNQGRTRAHGRGGRMRLYIKDNFRRDRLTPTDAATELGCSLRQVHSTCAALGASFGQLLIASRLEAAKKALFLSKERNIGSIAFDCGFSDPSHFARVFKRQFGVSPREYSGGALAERHLRNGYLREP